MKNLYRTIIATGLAAYALMGAKFVQAQGSNIISKPVGQGILPGGGAEGSDIKSSILFAKIIPFLITWMINLAVGIAVIAIIIGGYMYMTAYGNTDRRQQGTRTVIYAVIGLIIALTAYGIISVLTNIQLS